MSKINVGNELYLKGRIGWKGLSKDEYLDYSDYRIINGTALEDKYINWSKCGYINSYRYRESPEIQLVENDILISKDGTLGKIGYVRNLEKPSTVASGIFVLRNTIKDRLDTDYLYHFLKSNIFKNFIHRVKASGSTILHLYQRDLAQLELEVPILKDQQNISRVLNTIDAKIEVNNKINQELEAMAKTLYNYWFVQFDFPDKNGKPYKSSNGLMIFNEELKREIPKGWQNKKLSDFADCNKWNRTKVSSYDKINYLDTSSLTKNVIKSHQKLVFGKDKIPSRAQRIVSENDILFSTVRPNLLHYGIIKRPLENLVASTGFAQIRSKNTEVTNDFIYQVLSQDYISIRLHQIAVGSVSAYPSISHNDIMNLNIAFPLESNLIKKANIIFQQCNEKIALNLEQNQKLSELRDWLLPMLMNGQITVGEAEKEVESLQMVVVKPVNFSAPVIGTHIIKKLENSPGMGRTKFQKVLHLAEYVCKTELGGLYYQKTAGPHNDILINQIEGKFRQFGHVKVSRDIINGNTHFTYKTTSKTIESETAYKDTLSEDYRSQLDSLIDILKPLTLRETEAISTLYAVWNNRIIEKKEINNKVLISDFYNWSDRKKRVFVDTDIMKALEIMNNHSIIPKGWGSYIGKEN